jgi:hypothetical protein
MENKDRKERTALPNFSTSPIIVLFAISSRAGKEIA